MSMDFLNVNKFHPISIPQIDLDLMGNVINIIETNILNIDLADAEGYLIDPDELAFIKEVEHANPDYPIVGQDDYVNIYGDLADVLFLYGMRTKMYVDFGTGINPVSDIFNIVNPVATMQYHDQNTPTTPASNTLSSNSDLNFRLNPDVVVNYTGGSVEIGIKLGTVDLGIAYPGVCDHLAVVFTQASTTERLNVYKSNDNASWAKVSTASLSNAYGWQTGEYYTATYKGTAHPARVIKFSAPEQAVYFKIIIPTGGTTINVYGIEALTTFPVALYSGDGTNWTALKPYNTYSSPYFAFTPDLKTKGRWFAFRMSPTYLATTGAEVRIDNVAVFESDRYVGCGVTGRDKIIVIQKGQPGEVGDGQTGYVFNLHNINKANSVNIKIPIIPVRVLNFEVPIVGALEGFYLRDNARLSDPATGNYPIAKWILNANNDGKGELGDTSVVVTPPGAGAFTTEVTGVPAPTEFSINYDTGEIITGSATAGTEVITFYYNEEGSAALEISPDATTWSGAGVEIALISAPLPNQKAAFYIRANLSNYPDARLRQCPLLFKINFQDTEIPVLIAT